jgi:hypothetical protein
MFRNMYLLLSIEHLNMNFHTAVCVLWSFEVGYLAACVHNTIFYLGLIKIVDGKLWLSSEYKFCILFNLDICRIFVCFYCYCGIKVIKMWSNNVVAVGWRGLCLPVVGWKHRIIVLVDCFMCMVVFVLRIAYGQVVLLRTVLNFVAWQLEKASKYSVVI